MVKKIFPFAKEKIGKRISFSGEHVVYRYGKDRVIKFPSGPIHYVSHKEAYNKTVNEFKIIKKYLGEFLVESELRTYQNKNKQAYCIIQKYLADRPLNPAEVKDEKIHLQLKEIVRKSKEMYNNTGYVLEFFGLRGLLFHWLVPQMENIILTKNKELKIIDFGMVSDVKTVSSSPILRKFIGWAIKKQRKLLKLRYNV